MKIFPTRFNRLTKFTGPSWRHRMNISLVKCLNKFTGPSWRHILAWWNASLNKFVFPERHQMTCEEVVELEQRPLDIFQRHSEFEDNPCIAVGCCCIRYRLFLLNLRLIWIWRQSFKKWLTFGIVSSSNWKTPICFYLQTSFFFFFERFFEYYLKISKEHHLVRFFFLIGKYQEIKVKRNLYKNFKPQWWHVSKR